MNALTPMNVSQAQLPLAYEAAKAALANCVSLDECLDWADKAAALASYARQANDDTLKNHAVRIQGRAVRRCGELMAVVEPAHGANQNIGEGDLPNVLTRSEIARQAGLSTHQQKTAMRVANVPAETFEAAIESDAPPTVTKLADMGRVRRETSAPVYVAPVAADPSFADATKALGAVSDFAAFCRAKDPLAVARAVDPREFADARADVAVIDGWLDRFIVNLKG